MRPNAVSDQDSHANFGVQFALYYGESLVSSRPSNLINTGVVASLSNKSVDQSRGTGKNHPKLK